MLHISNYKKTYGSTTVLNIPQLQLEAGIYWLKGENGAGKTTFLKSIAGLIPFDGDIEVKACSLRKNRMLYTRNVSFGEAEPLYPAFLAGDDLLRFYEETKGRNKFVSSGIIESLGMKSYLKNKTSTYSSGMLKKLSLLLAFIGHPQLILLDEPFITLDVEAVTNLQQLITQSHQNGISFLISSHQELTLNTAHQTLVIRNQTVQHETHVSFAE